MLDMLRLHHEAEDDGIYDDEDYIANAIQIGVLPHEDSGHDFWKWWDAERCLEEHKEHRTVSYGKHILTSCWHLLTIITNQLGGSLMNTYHLGHSPNYNKLNLTGKMMSVSSERSLHFLVSVLGIVWRSYVLILETECVDDVHPKKPPVCSSS